MHPSAPLIGRSIFIVLEEFKKGDSGMSKLEKRKAELEKAKQTAYAADLQQEQIAETCVCCGKPATKIVYWGKAY